MWRAFVLGRVRCLVTRINAAILSSSLQLPRLLHIFEKELEGHGTVEADWVCHYRLHRLTSPHHSAAGCDACCSLSGASTLRFAVAV